jgi:hypothetical protein
MGDHCTNSLPGFRLKKGQLSCAVREATKSETQLQRSSDVDAGSERVNELGPEGRENVAPAVRPG